LDMSHADLLEEAQTLESLAAAAAASWTPILSTATDSKLLPEDDDDVLLGSPTVHRHLAKVVSSPFVRPVAPKCMFYKSPPPMVSDRLARSEKRERQADNIDSVAQLTFCDLGDVSSSGIFGLSAEEAELSRTISRTTRATTEAARDSSPTAPADDVSSVGVGSLNYATCNGRLSQNSLFSAGSSALGRSSSRGSLGSMGRRSGDTDTPPAGPHAFESHETLVKCPAPKRARVSATSSFHSISPRKFAFD